LEYLGRVDFQVKVRGFRIELGEVESALRQQEAVKEAVVVAKGEDAEKRLVAYVAPKAGATLEAEALKTSLRQRLPEYMVPGAVVVLEALPLTSNGKVDRKALPEPEAPTARNTYEAPRTEAEARIAAIWAEVLRVPQVGVKDDFFALGGHSLLATQVVSRVRAEMGAELPLRALFESRTVESLARQLERTTSSSMAALRRIQGNAARPLSFAQQRLWFIDQLEPGTALYNVPVALRLEGALRQDVLERALREVVRRHEALRTMFAQQDGQPIQVIHAELTLRLERLEVSAEDARQRIEQEMLKPFDLSRGPLIRALLLKLGESEHVLVVTLHHIVSDGWSLGVLIREVGALYAAFAEERRSPLAELPVQYGDFAAWQRDWLQGDVLARQVDYWKRKLTGAPPVLDLPTDHPRPPVRSSAGATLDFLWPQSLVQSLRELGKREGASLYMVLLAGWQVLLSRYSGQDDISVGSPTAGRTRAEVEGLIGFFVNTLVLRTQVSGEASFGTLLSQVRETVLEAQDHQQVPFEKLVEALQPERDRRHTPLFQVFLALQNLPERETRLPGLTLKPVAYEGRTSKFDLSLFFMEAPDGLIGAVEYSTSLFEVTTVRRMVEHLRVLLEGVVAKPKEAVGRLPMLTEAERQQVLVTWNQQQAEYDRDATIPRLFEAQAKRTPNAVAVVSGKQRLTYREVEAKANQLAHRLRKLGVGPESRVGLCVERTADVVVGTLGILKAGGAYVPLDPSYPKERLGWLLEDAQGPALVAHSHLLESLPAFSAQAVCLDREEEWAEESCCELTSEVRPENVAYLIYTSGSTGRPKGVAVTHRNAVAFLAWATETFTEAETKAVLAATSLNFDLSVFELFAPLVRGGSVVVVRNALHLVEEKPEAEVTLINTVPSAMAQLVRLNAVPPSVQVINLAGEALPETLAKAVYAVPTVKKLYNLYGPSEDTTYSTWSLVGRNEVPNIGRPLTNTRAYVLDKYLQPVPVGVAGELFLAGEGQARGYLLRPELTAEKFLPEVHGPEGSRMYRTGDRVRYRADGVLEYLGRVDFQVKVRGFRIELGEVESALRQQEAVKDAVVVAKGEGAEKRLVAYVAPKASATLDAEALKASLRQRLPEYMVPGAVVVLEALPLNSNGKVDRKALPEPEAPTARNTCEAPRTEVEARLAAIWAEVLRVPQVGVKDDFFALGGHSLLATQVVSRVRAEMGAELPLRALFESRTVESLARQLEKAAFSNKTAMERKLGDAARPLSFAQQRLWFIDQLEPGTALYNVPVALRLEGDLDVGILERALREVMRRHEALRTTFAVQDDQPIQVIHSDMALHLERAVVPAEDARQRIEQEMLKPFDLSRGPLIRALLLKLGESEHALVVTMHHIVSDGWSLGVLIREVGVLYTAYSSGQPSPLPELPVQYGDYAAWQRDWLRDETLRREVDYWKQSLMGAPLVLELPTDRPRPAVRTNAGTTLGFTLPLELSHRLSALARAEGASLFMVLLAGWQVLLSRYSGQDDISVGSPIAGRTRAEVEGLIGFFVNTLVLRAKVDGDASFRELLKQVRGTVLEAYEHQSVPFEKLVEALHPERSLSHTPLFQTSMSLQNVPVEESRLPGLVLKPVTFEGRTSKFDVSLFFTESPEGLLGAVEFSTDLFDEATVRRMVEHLRMLLEGMVAKPEAAVGRLPMLTEAERQQVLVTWNQQQAEYARDATIPRLFEAQAKRTPNAVAVVSGKQRLTYREVEAKANQLAHRLRKLGVGPESRVGLCVERTADVVVGTLGILKAGGAYVPLDPSYPKERLGWLLEDAQGPALVAHSHLLESLPAFSAQAVCLDTDATLATEPTEAPEPELRPENVAYLIYTSGSTGRPKGVAVTHRNAVAFLAWATETFTEEETKAVLAATSLNFDLSVFELFAPLVRGGSVVVVRNALHLAEEKPETDVTLINTVPSAMAQLVRLKAVPPSVQVINLAGEALPETLAKAVYAVPTVKKLYNLYGPSEDTTYSTWSLVGRNEVPNIGRPLTNTRAYVLDRYLQPVPVGVAGELFLAGEGQARGYLLRPELTAEKFLPEVHGPEGSRMYRTGDRVRYRADGVLEYLGRVDFQVKVRGFRIELGEVESALRQQEAVKEAVVVAKGEGAEKRLVAYVAPKAGATLEAESLKASLRHRLPEYMVPGAVVVLEALPLNSNGKVDREALPEPEAPASTHTYEAPRTEAEAKLAAIWAEVLRVPRVGVKDDFFALGGHSLLVTQVVSRIRTEIGVELPLRALFETPTLEALAQRMGTASRPLSSLPGNALIGTAPPLSFAQQRLWFIDQLDPGTALYNVPVAVRLVGSLDVAALERALNEVVRRHDSLRTTFEERGGQAIQVIRPTLSLELAREDLRSVDEARREAEAHRQVEQEMLRPFDLVHGPLIRTRLFTLGDREHVLVVTMHHIVSDGWSLGVLIREVGALYEAFASGQPSPLPELPVQYARYASWQRGRLQGEVLARQVDYWKRKLAGAPPVLELPTDRPRPPERGIAGAKYSFTLSRSLTGELKALAQREGASLYMVLLAGWQVLMARYSGQQDISVGSPIAGRMRAELEGLIGFFVNTLVLRANVDGALSFRRLLSQVRETVLDAYEHQEVPFEKLVEVLQPERNRSHTPLFQTMLALQNMPLGELRLPDLVLQPVNVESPIAQFDLSVSFMELPQGFSGTMEYSTELFDAGTIQRMASHLLTLLEGVVASPDTRVSRLPLLSGAERREMLVEWNATRAPFPEACLHVLFEAQARRAPEVVAAVFEGTQLTYAQLDARANQLAHALRRRGVGPEVRVALSVERSLEVVVGLLGILKAGGAWVPVDPLLPRERLAFMLEDSVAQVLVTQQPLVDRFPEALHARALCLDAERESLAQEPTDAPVTGVTPANMAYLLYTSGSTGTPKGTAVEHRGVANLVTHEAVAYGIGPGSRVLQFASLSFDLSVEEIFTTLCNGATLVLAPLEKLMPGAPLPVLLREQELSVVSLTPAALAVTSPESLPEVRTVISGGDALPEDVVARWAPGRRLLNTYGPTEATVVATLGEVVADGTVPSIGKPLANVRVYVLDPQGQPVPVGVRGELHIGGVGVARGYAGRPGLTAERFVPDAFSGEEGARLYRTGDVVRWRADGRLDFVGRLDSQVKVRGFRIELGEVEAALTRQPGVSEAVVLVWGDGADRRLVGYVVAKEGHSLDVDTLRAGLRQGIPEYMVPSALRVLDALPLNANGKVDRKALPEPEAAREGDAFVAPRTVTEAKLASVWAEVLRLERVGVKDNFFALGGHSLLATQVVSRIRTSLGVEMPLRLLFEAPTVEALAQRIEQLGRSGVPTLSAGMRPASLPLSFAQQRLWFIDQLEPGSSLYNVPTVVRLEGDLDAAALEQSLREVVQRHEALRTTFEEEAGQPVQRIHASVDVPLNVLDLRDSGPEREDVARQRVMEEMAKPFDLMRGPLLRALLVRLDARDHLLVVTMHHAVSDGWSVGVLLRELGTLYTARATGHALTLPPLPVQYADYAAWQRDWLRDETLRREVDYWKQSLMGAPPVLELPTDRPRPAVRTNAGTTMGFTLPLELSQRLGALARAEGASLFMVLLTGWQVLLSRYSGQDDISVGSPIAGRTRAEVEGLIGFFVNTLVLRTQVDGDQSFRALLARVRERVLGAYEHQDVPFEKLVEALHPERSLSHTPLFQTLMALQNVPIEETHLPSLVLKPMSLEGRTSKFDLSLFFVETPQGLSGGVEYSTDLFEASTVRRMMEHLRVLLEGVVAKPETAVGRLPMLTETERQQVLVTWNQQQAEYDRDATIPRLFEAQAKRTPNAVAVMSGKQRLTYREVEAKANQLAHRLRKLGVGPESRVGLCVER
ncbi:non-ribosomal peptide synthetase, partial [Corallococcus sp. AS-1-6]|uniref:non-ribosomal peptide synthetase n=1 Tax=Corallococcus sp. AS-1-6 TaxID=2874599 RepID=UPI001CBDB83C